MSKLTNWYRSVFHGKGFRAYKPSKAREQYASSILKIADKFFWAPMAYLVSIGLNGSPLNNEKIIFTGVFLAFGMWLRHVGLIAIDEVENEKKKNESVPRFKRAMKI